MLEAIGLVVSILSLIVSVIATWDVIKQRTGKFFSYLFWSFFGCLLAFGFISLLIGFSEGFSEGLFVVWIGTSAFFAPLVTWGLLSDEAKQARK